jgi:arabinofuranosyltransferase
MPSPSHRAPPPIRQLLLASARRYWPVALATIVLLPHALMFDFVNDDAYISFRYARNLSEHGQLVFNLGERVEGFTNFLWTVLLAGGIHLGWSPVHLSRFLGVAFAVGVLALLVRMSLRLDEERPSPWHAVAPLGLAATGAFACWCTGGLETQLFTLLALLGFDRTLAEVQRRRGFASGLCFALAAMTRPEGIFLFALCLLFRLLRNLVLERRWRPRWHEAGPVIAFAAVFVPYYIWRWSYFGWPFPNTFYVKSAGGPGTWQQGLYYLRRFVEDYAVAFLAPLVLAGWLCLRGRDPGRRRIDLFGLGALVTSCFALYVVKVGGDFMGLYRFILPVVPLGALCIQEGIRAVFGRLRPYVPRTVLVVAGVTAAAAFAAGSLTVSIYGVRGWYVKGVLVNSDQGIDSPGYLKQYVQDRIPVGIWLGQHARAGQLASVGGAGVIPYYSRLRAFDTFGLVDETIAHDPGMTRSTRPGHQKWVADWYLFQRRPTLITHVYGLRERKRDDEAHWLSHGYEWVTATIPGLSPPPYYSFLKRVDQAFGPFPARLPPPPPAIPEMGPATPP